MSRTFRASSLAVGFAVATVVVMLTAVVCLTPASARLSPWRGVGLSRHAAVAQLPDGLVLPASESNLRVSSLVAADFDADGDIDVVAADTSSGTVGIVVWVNDGQGRLTRQRPAQPHNFGSEPASPSVEQRQATVGASIQPDAPAIAAIGVNAWLTLPSQPFDLPAPPGAPSATLASLRSRSPPARS